MKKTLIYSAFILLLASVACNKTDHVVSGDGNIRFAPATTETRALIEDATDLQAQTFQVYDFMGTTKYIDETISYADGAWNYASGSSYAWKDGSHKLFGYTSGAGTFADNALTVSKTLTAAADDQVDILYSNVVSTTAEAWKATEGTTVSTPVALHMKHLFAAVSIMVKNASENAVTLNKADVKIPNKGSATVTFGDETTVSYGEEVTEDGAFITATQFTGAIAAATSTTEGGMVDVLTQQTVTTDPIYQVVWPQTFAEGSELEVTVNYTMTYTKEDGTSASDTKNAKIKLPATTWEAGKKYTYILNIYPTDTKLDFVVQDWTPGQAGAIDTEDGSINMSNVTWMNTKVDLNANGIFGEGTETGDLYENTVNNNKYKQTVTMFYNAVIQVTAKYEENVTDPDTGEVIHHAGDPIVDTYPEDVTDPDTGEVIHHAGDEILDEKGRPIYKKISKTEPGYFPAQGYFTVNYPKTGTFKMDLVPAYGETTVDKSKYEIYIYDSSTESFRPIKAAGETISSETVYFQVRAAANQDGKMHKATIDIWFKGTEEGAEWISAYSEIRANYACVIPAVSTGTGD